LFKAYFFGQGLSFFKVFSNIEDKHCPVNILTGFKPL